MNRTAFILSLILLAAPAFAETAEKPSVSASDPFGVSRSLRDSVFVVETDDDSARDSLNRVSGEIDLGFTTSDQTFKSEDHHRPGALGRSQAMEDVANRY